SVRAARAAQADYAGARRATRRRYKARSSPSSGQAWAAARRRAAGRASRPQVTSCGSLVKVLLQYELSGDRVHCLVFYSAQPALGLDRAEALVDARNRQPEAAFELAREALDALRQRMLAIRGDRQADDQLSRLPFLHQAADGLESRRRDRRQRMRGAQLGLPDCYSNALETKIEG